MSFLTFIKNKLIAIGSFVLGGSLFAWASSYQWQHDNSFTRFTFWFTLILWIFLGFVSYYYMGIKSK